MTLPFIYTLLSVVAVSGMSLIGAVALSLRDSTLRASLFALVSLATGALLGDAFIHLIPEAFAEAANPLTVSLTVIAGVLIFFVLEKGLHWHHHLGIEDSEPAVHPLGRMILVSDGVHNFVDGLIIGASYLVSIEVGIATTIAVILHEIPQEIGDFGALIHAGYTKAKALWYNFLSGVWAIAGALLTFLLGANVEGLTTVLVPLAAGGFIYVALSDLIPELHKEKSLARGAQQVLWILVGVLAMVFLLAFEVDGHAHGLEEIEVHEESDGHHH